MSVIPSVLYPGGQLTTAAAILATGAANAQTLVTKAVFTNTDTSARLLTVYIVRSGGSPGTANTVTYQTSLGAKQTYEATEIEDQILGPGDTIQAKADAAAVVNCTGVSGYVIA